VGGGGDLMGGGRWEAWAGVMGVGEVWDAWGECYGVGRGRECCGVGRGRMLRGGPGGECEGRLKKGAWIVCMCV
jgi:hypothetical protein